MTFYFHPEAEREFLESIAYYESCKLNLGLDFSIAVRVAIDSVCEFPEAWPVLHGQIRRRLISSFPYGILYEIRDRSIQILAVMHLKRESDYWKNRII